MRTLSGGEQAFSTLALALSMWQFSATPVRAMDEFDKNMDATYQKVSLQLLLELFGEQSKKQFLILTPLDYSALLTELNVCSDAQRIRFHRLESVR